MSRPKRSRKEVNYQEVTTLDDPDDFRSEPARKRQASDKSKVPKRVKKQKVSDASDDMDFGLVEQPQQPVERKKRSSLQEKKEEAELRLALELSMKDSRQSYQAPNNTVFNTKKFNCPEGLHGANVEDEAEEDVSPPHGSNGDACKRTHKEHYKAPAQAKFDQNGDVQSAPVPHGTIPGNSKSKGILGSAPSKERQQFRPDSPRSIPEATTALQPSSSASASKVSLFCINSLPLRIGLSRNARVKPLLSTFRR